MNFLEDSKWTPYIIMLIFGSLPIMYHFGFSKSLAQEVGSRGITVNVVAPGFIDTDMTRGITPEKFAERVASIRMGRVGTPDEVANVALFLASDLSSYVTGQTIGVDGGMLI